MSFINSTSPKQAFATLARSIDQALGETLIITPCVLKPNYPAQPCDDQAITIQGVFTTRTELALDTGGHGHHVRRGGGNGIVETKTPIFSFARAQLPWGLQRGDRIQRCCDGSQYEVTRVESDVTSQRITVQVVELGVAEQ